MINFGQGGLVTGPKETTTMRTKRSRNKMARHALDFSVVPWWRAVCIHVGGMEPFPDRTEPCPQTWTVLIMRSDSNFVWKENFFLQVDSTLVMMMLWLLKFAQLDSSGTN